MYRSTNRCTAPPPGLLKDPPLPFNSVAQRFDQRFAAFHCAVSHPEPLAFSDFAASTDASSLLPAQLLMMAIDAFSMVRGEGEKKGGMRAALVRGEGDKKGGMRAALTRLS